MTASGRYASPDSSFGRSTSNAAARGGALIAVAVVIGFLLLWQGGVGGSDDTAATGAATNDAASATTEDPGASGTDGGEGATGTEDPTADDGTEADPAVEGTTDTTTTTTTTVSAATRAPGEVRAAVANGTGTAGLAGARSGELATAGYVTAAVNAANDTAVSNVYYIDGYGLEAEQVAIVLGGTAAVLRPATPAEIAELVREANRADVDGFQVLVVLGTDGVLG
ncbi:MAG: LytR C-terminal domain-containing protein [Actinomycetota bacterium]